MRTFLYLLCWLLGTATPAVADYTLQIGNVFWLGSPGGYDCFSSAEYPNTVNFTLTKTKPGNRSYAVTAGPSATTGTYQRQLTAGASRLNYQLYTSSARNLVLKAPPEANAGEVIAGSHLGGAGETLPLSLTFHLPPEQVVAPGSYTDHLVVSVYDRYNDAGTPFDTREITLTVVVAAGAALAVVPTGTGFGTSASQRLNFGGLATGQQLGCDLLVRKNTGVNLTFSSRNGGAMRLLPKPTDDRVPYLFEVNNSVLSLSSVANLSLPGGVSPPGDGNRLPVQITIGEFGDVAPGDYQDEIVISVVAR